MQHKIRPYLQFLINQNVVYFLLFGGLVLISILIVPFFIAQIEKGFSDIAKSKIEASSLQIKQKILQSVINESKDDIDKDLALVTGLIPDSEDFFSMIYSLEKLSQSSGFIINNYSVNLKKSDSNKLSITVTGIGDSASFLELLRTYNFAGGRLITAEKIGIDPILHSGVSLDLNFYNQKPTLDSTEKLDFQASINELNVIRSKVKFSIVNESIPSQTGEVQDYPTKTSLF